ncbi:hypothetical protein AMC78_CH03145 [Rhizobium phaseoli]|uniref:hypothetical protein n=1 Tax=Rhizobium phaseoli TaxID=396 RepID=UPI0007F0B0D5|nr:hypothetical protein [Rhizobium phaseoli]ANM05214.1 hypothetical protein AMC78_CH03145 [Rhizobium phaseoli]
MLRIFIVFMIIGTATPSASQSLERRTQAPPAAAPDDPPPQASYQLSLPVRIVQQPDTETESDRLRQSEQDDRDKENLAIQKELANLGNKTLQLSFWQLILGIVGAFGLLLTLILTRRSVRAAEEATATTREMMRRQLRAYVLVEQVTIVSTDNNTKYGVNIRFRNGGQTPAIDLKVIANWQTFNVGDNKIPQLPQHQARPFSILPGAERDKLIGWMPAAHAAELNVGMCQMDVIGIATYEDNFGGQHTIHFRYEGGGDHQFKLGSELAAHAVGNYEIEKLDAYPSARR